MRPIRKARFAMLTAAALAAPLLARAQAQVDNRVGQVDNRVGAELYGHENSTARYPVGQYRLLPSEERNAIWRSGMLPSEFRMNREAFGPLPPEGTINYVTRRSPLQRALNLPEPQLVNPGYQLGGQGQPGQRLESWRESPLGGYPQTAQAGVAASGRVPGVSVNRPTVPRADLGLQQQPQPAGAPLPPIQPGPLEPEEATRGPSAAPRPLQPPPPTTAPTSPSEMNAPPGPLVPSLTGAPDRPLPIGPPPPATPAGPLLAR
jgi:hypothetical protein